jgi:beta-lactam-binding protein with PASTA domain
MKGIIRFISSGRVWMNVLLITVFTGLVVFLTMLWLGMYTMHGESLAVPELKGKPLEDIETLLANTDMTYEITDSIYTDEYQRGAVVSQNPKSGKQVKKGRTIYLTVNSVLPEMVEAPDLIGKSKRIAVPILEITGLELISLKYRPDESCTDCVVGLEYNSKKVEPGDKLRKGEGVSLILGQISDVPTISPDLLGLTYAEACSLIISSSLNVGSILLCAGCETADDTLGAFVVNQRPQRNEMINLGTFVDLYLTTDTSMVNDYKIPTDTILDEF